MRSIKFEVPLEALAEFADAMTSRELDNTISGVTEDDEIIIEIEFEKDENDEVDEMEEIFQKLLENIEEENED